MRFLVHASGDRMFGFLAREDGVSPLRASLASSARAALLDALTLPVKALDACASPFFVATANQAAGSVAPVVARAISHNPRVVKGGCALRVTLGIFVGTQYYLPAFLAASKLRSYMTPGVHDFASSEEAHHWTVAGRALRPLVTPAFPVRDPRP
eukprot:201901-Pleurochrysis_carterae.AAC.2